MTPYTSNGLWDSLILYVEMYCEVDREK